ncbi:uncharacterized protein OCT59_023687 [Rhizophagus irregularis]|uniref:uncharacterized protein n=1 Tax=Rhizophagus irregularis TaxID=588596 RepID=UPI003331612B|nr:hypothetical protein OCT59_023687 [Rhizophagus irregularis]
MPIKTEYIDNEYDMTLIACMLRLTINVKNLTLPPIVFRYFSSFNFENGVLNLGWGDRFLCCRLSFPLSYRYSF